jgi:hypothetical protein
MADAADHPRCALRPALTETNMRIFPYAVDTPISKAVATPASKN